jgi:acetate kinase
MTGFVLVLNAGSSSLKFSVFRDGEVDTRGQIEGIGTGARFSVKDARGEKLADEKLEVADSRAAIDVLSKWLRSKYEGGKITGVGHRVVHGGPRYSTPVVVTREILAELKTLTPLAPLHQPHNLAPIEALMDRMADVPQVACFDTGFHRGHSEVATVVPIPREFRSKGVERYGFHGLSYEYIASRLPEVAPEIADGRVIVAHLGSGASMCAMKNRKSVDTTMAFTALDGICMGTRPGALDPGIVLYFIQGLGLSASKVEEILYKKSGLLGLSGITNDMKELLGRSEPEARLAVDYFVFRAAKEIGALAAVLEGIDALVFTGGIGENSPEIRKRISAASAWLGL